MTKIGGSKWDGDSVYVNDNPSDGVDHAASAKANLRAAGQDLKEILPDKTADMIHSMRKGGSPTERVIAGLLLPLAVATDVLEVAYKPLAAVKDAADSLIHGIAALFGKR